MVGKLPPSMRAFRRMNWGGCPNARRKARRMRSRTRMILANASSLETVPEIKRAAALALETIDPVFKFGQASEL
jgi:hypothetical protein